MILEIISGLIAVVGIVTVGWIIYSYNKFSPGILKRFSRSLVFTSFTGALFSIWVFLINIGVVAIGDLKMMQIPGIVLVSIFYVLMLYNAYCLDKMARLFGFKMKKKKGK